MFESVCSQGSRRSGRTLSVSLLMHLIVVGALLAAPLWCFEQLPQEAFVTYLAVPPPAPTPPAPPPAPVPQKAPTTAMRSRILRPDFTQPLEIPKEVPEAPEELPEITGTWLESWDRGAPGGITGGQPGGLGHGVGVTGATVVRDGPPPPPPPARHEPIRHGGDVQSAKLIHRVDPIYPPLARQARVQGPVMIQAIVDEEGRVTNLKVISGHPLLVDAALKAVAQWRYSPTLLNGEPVPVITTVTVNFQLR